MRSNFNLSFWSICQPLVLLFSVITIAGCSSFGYDGARNDLHYQRDARPYYIFKTRELNFDEGQYGVFCSQEHLSLSKINIESGGPYNSSQECNNSDTLSALRDEREKEVRSVFKKYGKYKNNIINGEVKIGMPKAVVIYALGEPFDTNTTETSGSYTEQLVYSSQYIYIRSGRVSAIQDH